MEGAGKEGGSRMWREFHLILSKNTHARADKRELTSTRKNFFVFVNFCLLLYCLSSTYFVLGLADRGSYFQTFIQWPLVITLYIVSTSKKIKRKKMKWEIKRKSALSRPSCFIVHVGNKIFRSNRDNLLWNHINNVQTDKLIKLRPRRASKRE